MALALAAVALGRLLLIVFAVLLAVSFVGTMPLALTYGHCPSRTNGRSTVKPKRLTARLLNRPRGQSRMQSAAARASTPGRTRTDTADPFRRPASTLGLRGRIHRNPSGYLYDMWALSLRSTNICLSGSYISFLIAKFPKERKRPAPGSADYPAAIARVHDLACRRPKSQCDIPRIQFSRARPPRAPAGRSRRSCLP